MRSLLILVLYILAAIGIGWLCLWGATALGFPHTPSMIVAGIVAICVVLLGLSRTGGIDI